MKPCVHHDSQGFQFFPGVEVGHGMLPFSHGAAGADTLAYHVTMLRDKVQQLEHLVGMVVSPAAHHLSRHTAVAMAAPSACSVLQEITAAASAAAHRLSLDRGGGTAINGQMFPAAYEADHTSSFGRETATLWDAGASTSTAAADRVGSFSIPAAPASASNGKGAELTQLRQGDAEGNRDVVELDASYLLAMYALYCQVCGKGFKRDSNLRMHMRAHGDEYKTWAALSNPSSSDASSAGEKRRYSCPEEGCRWNRRHPRFQALKSIVCAKNHYRRSHCLKMYACQRCGDKQFAVLSDLRTHEKHCGELRWRCSCGTFFSRKDKLMGHVALFAAGHEPVLVTATTAASTGTL